MLAKEGLTQAGPNQDAAPPRRILTCMILSQKMVIPSLSNEGSFGEGEISTESRQSCSLIKTIEFESESDFEFSTI